ncbi:MAG: SGNH/GDSL hydrolase family protein [Akkermansiaceae bacterium]
MNPKNIFLTSLALAFSFLASSPVSADDRKLVVKEGEKIAFLGDSITQAGNRKNGYVTLVMDALNREGLKLTKIPAGISGHKSTNMLARVDKDVISKKPDWMLLSCGVNDVWHFTLKLGKRTFQGVPLEDYKKNIRQIIEKAEGADIKVVILTSTMIGEDPEKETNKKLIPYNNFLREIAKEKKLLVADLSKDMHEQLKEMPDEKGKARMFGEPKYDRNIKNKLTTDGCHMNKLGNIMMAKGILRTLGLSEKKITVAEESWLGK